MSDPTSLSDILSDKPVEREAPAAEPQAPEPTETPVERPQSLRAQHKAREDAARQEGAPRTEDGKFAPKEPETKPEEPVKAEAPKPPSQEMTEKEKAFLRAAQEERTKRQELERRLAALEKPPEQPKPFWDDPENALKQFEGKINEAVINTKFSTSKAIARSKYDDFDDKLSAFGELLQSTPGLHQQWVQAADPAEFAYKTGKNHQNIQQAGSIDALLKKNEEEVTARVRAQLEAEYKAKAEAAAKERAALPGSLSDVRGTSPTRTVWNGPRSLDEILSGKG